MAYCAHCGGPLREDQRFCPHCGQPTEPSRVSMPGGPPPPKKRTGLWIALAALLLAVIVACVLVFVVFYDDIFKGGGGSTPEATVSKMLDAMEDQDIDTVFSLMDQTVITETFGEGFLDMAKDAIAAEMFGEGSLKFSDIEMETEMMGDAAATVTIVEGKVTMSDGDGEGYTEDVSEADEPVSFQLVKKDGSWYIDPATFDW